jgi:sugar phosphate isomerase/epimerase
MDRRSFIKCGALSTLTLPFNRFGFGGNMQPLSAVPASNALCAFIKPLEKYAYADLAVLLSEAGFDGADISMRKGGLIDPETARTELPKLMRAFETKNLSVPMAVSGITSPADTGVEGLIQLMADSGIRYYRLGAVNYDRRISMQANLDKWKSSMSRLSEINARYKVHGAIQNHVGTGLGAAVWDAYWVVQDCDPQYLGIQYDIRHAVAEGMGSWPLALEMALGYIRTTCMKDFTWVKEKNGFKPVSVPLGEGIVDFNKYIELIRKENIDGPVSLHYEYPLLTEEQLRGSASEQMKWIISKLKHDLDVYKSIQKINKKSDE